MRTAVKPTVQLNTSMTQERTRKFRIRMPSSRTEAYAWRSVHVSRRNWNQWLVLNTTLSVINLSSLARLVSAIRVLSVLRLLSVTWLLSVISFSPLTYICYKTFLSNKPFCFSNTTVISNKALSVINLSLLMRFISIIRLFQY